MNNEQLQALAHIAGVRIHEHKGELHVYREYELIKTEDQYWQPHVDMNQALQVWQGIKDVFMKLQRVDDGYAMEITSMFRGEEDKKAIHYSRSGATAVSKCVLKWEALA